MISFFTFFFVILSNADQSSAHLFAGFTFNAIGSLNFNLYIFQKPLFIQKYLMAPKCAKKMHIFLFKKWSIETSTSFQMSNILAIFLTKLTSRMAPIVIFIVLRNIYSHRISLLDNGSVFIKMNLFIVKSLLGNNFLLFHLVLWH